MNDRETIINAVNPILDETLSVADSMYPGSVSIVVRGWGGQVTVDPSELRDAIDKAVGKREGEENAQNYSAKQRARHLRHIEDIEATLRRRNERHEADQERIRELEADLVRARNAAQVQVQRVKEMAEVKTAREYLELAWDAAQVPADGMIHKGEPFLAKRPREALASVYGPADSPRESGVSSSYERRLLDPRPEPSAKELRRKGYKDAGLADWEIELLMESER